MAEACVYLEVSALDANLGYRQYFGIVRHSGDSEGQEDDWKCYGPMLALVGVDDWQDMLLKMRAAGKDGRVVEIEIVNLSPSPKVSLV